ncbi:hypothetical protein DFH07DRAFT_956312 [Mycena maculata]|uniref:Uncharacterized protein n=1 Tax=Mycena maculata TaxID=230809 RepID=A0AAD7NJ10_9AGAR|nr:hypothetical protein DFH07DRAFT_956312 [Mycena maculata]
MSTPLPAFSFKSCRDSEMVDRDAVRRVRAIRRKPTREQRSVEWQSARLRVKVRPALLPSNPRAQDSGLPAPDPRQLRRSVPAMRPPALRAQCARALASLCAVLRPSGRSSSVQLVPARWRRQRPGQARFAEIRFSPVPRNLEPRCAGVLGRGQYVSAARIRIRGSHVRRPRALIRHFVKRVYGGCIRIHADGCAACTPYQRPAVRLLPRGIERLRGESAHAVRSLVPWNREARQYVGCHRRSPTPT